VTPVAPVGPLGPDAPFFGGGAFGRGFVPTRTTRGSPR
jgi:hypothetical protein